MELDDFKRKKRLTNDVTAGVDKSDTVREDNIIDLFRSYQKKKQTKGHYDDSCKFRISCYLHDEHVFPDRYGSSWIFPIGCRTSLGGRYLYISGIKHLLMKPTYFPIKDFLGRAERQISYFNVTDYLIVIPLLLIIGTGGGLVFIATLLKYTANEHCFL